MQPMTGQTSSAESDRAVLFKEIFDDPTIGKAEKLEKMSPLISEARAHCVKLEAELAGHQHKKFVLESLVPWFNTHEYHLERNDCSRLHKLADAANTGKLICFSEKDQKVAQESGILFQKAQVFVVTHDWASAFGDAIGTLKEEFLLPYPHCAFEFRVNGKSVIVITLQPEGGEVDAIWFVGSEQGQWVFFCDDTVGTFGFIWSQIKAICIALDAEVATHDVIRAPAALNKKIERANRTPVFDHHVVSLAKRHRVAHSPNSEPSGRHVRLHFRRGHWRHFENHKTWVKWMMVGDPSLGFIDKHYSL